MRIFPLGSMILITKLSMLNTEFILMSSQLIMKQIQHVQSYGAKGVASASSAGEFVKTCIYTKLCFALLTKIHM